MQKVMNEAKILQNAAPKTERGRLFNRICSNYLYGNINFQLHDMIRLGQTYESDGDNVMALVWYENASLIAQHYIRNPMEALSLSILKLRALSNLKWIELMQYSLSNAYGFFNDIEKYYIYIGITEDLENSLKILNLLFPILFKPLNNISKHLIIERDNIDYYKPLPSSKNRILLENRNKLDKELYKYVKKKHESFVKQCI